MHSDAKTNSRNQSAISERKLARGSSAAMFHHGLMQGNMPSGRPIKDGINNSMQKTLAALAEMDLVLLSGVPQARLRHYIATEHPGSLRAPSAPVQLGRCACQLGSTLMSLALASRERGRPLVF